MPPSFGDIIREWRGVRRFSQLQLSLEAEMSARHLSFLESGRANPSRTMVLKLAEALAMPKGAANQALSAAGFANSFPSLPQDADMLAPVRDAIDLMLANHDPLPAVALDRHWNVINVNKGAAFLFSALGVNVANLIEALIGAANSEMIENWEEVALLTLARLRAEIIHFGGDEKLENLVQQLSNLSRLEGADIGSVDFNQVVIPTVFNMNGARLSLFSTLAQFGAVQDVSTSETRIELMFPVDETTRRYFNKRGN